MVVYMSEKIEEITGTLGILEGMCLCHLWMVSHHLRVRFVKPLLKALWTSKLDTFPASRYSNKEKHDALRTACRVFSTLHFGRLQQGNQMPGIGSFPKKRGDVSWT